MSNALVMAQGTLNPQVSFEDWLSAWSPPAADVARGGNKAPGARGPKRMDSLFDEPARVTVTVLDTKAFQKENGWKREYSERSLGCDRQQAARGSGARLCISGRGAPLNASTALPGIST